MMKKCIKVITLFLLLILIGAQAYAWNGKAHRIISAIAYRQLDEEAQKEITELLKYHPDYPKWEKETPEDIDFGLFLFMRCSTWPDEIRANDKGNPYNHPEWHYVTYQIKPNGELITESPSPKNDVVYGLQQSEMFILNKEEPDSVRAIFLSWLNHLAGDIHMPLHCGSLFNRVYPEGDRGGNDFWVEPDDKPAKLHKLWDNALGRDWEMRPALNNAILLETKIPQDSLPELDPAKDFRAWSIESNKLAFEKAYLECKLKGSSRRENAPPLPEGYMADMKAVSERRIVLAGYRLAEKLKKYFQ